MSEKLGDVDALLEISQLIKGDDMVEAVEKILSVVERWEEEEEEEEEEDTRPEGSIMWEIEVTANSIRTYHVPATSAEAALEFFNTYDDSSDLYDFFCDGDDMGDGEADDAKVIGMSPSWVRYTNEKGEY